MAGGENLVYRRVFCPIRSCTERGVSLKHRSFCRRSSSASKRLEDKRFIYELEAMQTGCLANRRQWRSFIFDFIEKRAPFIVVRFLHRAGARFRKNVSLTVQRKDEIFLPCSFSLYRRPCWVLPPSSFAFARPQPLLCVFCWGGHSGIGCLLLGKIDRFYSVFHIQSTFSSS